jgi:hypothetical protein
MTPTTPDPKSLRTYTGVLNDLGDELVVHPGTSDWGGAGWFVSVEVRAAGRDPFLTPKVFFPGTSDEVKEEALADARTWKSDEF